jgi:[acyl-carrier-protein] S-malonyltransferase
MSGALAGGRRHDTRAILEHSAGRNTTFPSILIERDAKGSLVAKTVLLFPGQGAQVVGMGAEVKQFPAAAALFDRASEILGYDLLQVCVEGPAEKLNTTAVSQPALYVSGLAAFERWRLENPLDSNFEGAAGLSLGEYTALAATGALSFEDGLRVVKIRGESMQAAADAVPSGMVSVLGLEAEKVEALAAKARSAGRLWLANYLCPGNIAVSGDAAACAEVEKLGEEFGATKIVRLAVAGAFHTPIMRPADEALAAALAGVEINPPKAPVYSNVDAKPHVDPAEIRGLLVRQVLEPVLWEASVRKLLEDGFDNFVELGPGRVLAGLLKRIHRKAAVSNLSV